MKTVYEDSGWRLPDELWSRMEVFLPAAKPHSLGCDRSRVPNRSAMDAIFLLLRTVDAGEGAGHHRHLLFVFC